MSRRAGNTVMGPTSALTSFLREHGITARHSYGGRQEQAASSETEGAGSSRAQDADTEASPTRRSASGYVSDNLDESEEEQITQPKKKRKLTKAAEAKLKAKEKAALNKKGQKSKPESDEEEEEDEYNAPSKGVINGAIGGQPPVGHMKNCAQCSKKFTVTKYTISNDSGWLCHPCAKSSGTDPFSKKAAPKKRKGPTEKRTVQNFEQVEPVKSLTSMCISIIGRYIDQVEELGDIGAVNMDKICKIVSKTRNLTEHNVRLLYNVTNTSLVIYDSTNLKTEAYSTMAMLNPNLERLTIHVCGQMESVALDNWCKSFKHLTRLELNAPFLVREEAWITFLKAKGPQLTGFLITNAPRFTTQCLDTLIESAPGLSELRLAELTNMQDAWLEGLATLKKLTSLDLSSDRSGKQSLTSEPIIELLKAVGKKLTALNLRGNEELDDVALKDGIAKYCKSVENLELSLVPLLTDEGVSGFFSALPKSNRLTHLDMSRCHLLESLSLDSLLKHSGPTLETLNINGWKGVGEDSLSKITEKAPRLAELDVGWCREVNDLVMGRLLNGGKLRQLRCFGCNRITGNCPKRAGVTIIGVETDVRRH